MNAWKRFFWKLVISGIILYLLSIRFADISLGVPIGQHPLEAGWAKTGLSVETIDLEGWDCVTCSYETEEQLMRRIKRLVKALNLHTEEAPLVGGGKGFRYVNLTGRTPEGGQAVLVLQSIALEEGGETHLGFTLTDTGREYPVEQLIERYNQRLRTNGMKKPLAIAIQGEAPGRLTDKQTEELFERCFRSLRATRVNGGLVEDYHNWRGKSGILNEAKGSTVDGINLEVSATYDMERDVTQITMATPSITEGT